MGKRKRIRWSANLAYAVGLITTDGCLSKDGRHIDLTSKDLEQIQHFKKILHLNNKIGLKYRGSNHSVFYYRIQMGNVIFYRFLLNIGLTPHKSRTLGKLKIPKKYFSDFLRGCLDGDGNISLAKHPESKYLQLRIRFSSGSLEFIKWLKYSIKLHFEIPGGFISLDRKKNVCILTFAKADSTKLLAIMYYVGVKYYLKRKFIYQQSFLGEW